MFAVSEDKQPLENTEAAIPMPMVSVVVPTYNRAGLLKETLDSIFSQTFTDFELIIIDNMSDDGTESYVRGIQDPRVRYFRNPNNGIIAVSRNLGIEKSRGTYVAFCDDDDLWLPEKLEKQVEHFADEGISCVASDCIPIGEVKYFSKTLSFRNREFFRDFSYKDTLLFLNPVISSSVISRRDYLISLNGFDESSDFRFIEDWELWLRLSRKGPIRILTEPLLMYRMYQKPDRDERSVTLKTLKIIDKHEALGFMDHKTGLAARANCSIVIGRAYLEAGDNQGIKYYLRGLFGCSSFSLRMKALFGLNVFLFPVSIRKALFRLAYRKK